MHFSKGERVACTFTHANGGELTKKWAGAMICLAEHTHLPFRWLIGSPDQVQSELESFG